MWNPVQLSFALQIIFREQNKLHQISDSSFGFSHSVPQRCAVPPSWPWRTSYCRPLPAGRGQCRRAQLACSPVVKATVSRETGRQCAWALGTGLLTSLKPSVKVMYCVCMCLCVWDSSANKEIHLFASSDLRSEVRLSCEGCKLVLGS